MSVSILLASLAAVALGARHGLDWDHLSAIADLVGSTDRAERRSLLLPLWYCIGHATVIVLIGSLAGVIGVHLPSGIDRVFEVLVGVTLVVLGCLILTQIVRRRRDYRYAGRYALLLRGLALVRRFRSRDAAVHGVAAPSPSAAFTIGLIHGTGAETPSQLLLFASAAAAASGLGAVVMLLSFGLGLVACDLAAAAVVLSGRLGSARLPYGQLALGTLTGAASVAIGVVFIVARAAALPSLAGG